MSTMTDMCDARAVFGDAITVGAAGGARDDEQTDGLMADDVDGLSSIVLFWCLVDRMELIKGLIGIFGNWRGINKISAIICEKQICFMRDI